jgi:hypothetical protein
MPSETYRKKLEIDTLNMLLNIKNKLDGRTYESCKDDIKFAVGLSVLNKQQNKFTSILNMPDDTKQKKSRK